MQNDSIGFGQHVSAYGVVTVLRSKSIRILINLRPRFISILKPVNETTTVQVMHTVA